ADPADGEISFEGPDVAVVQLSNLGAPLRSELKLAAQPQWDTLRGAHAGLLGFRLDSHQENRVEPPIRHSLFGAGTIADVTDDRDAIDRSALPNLHQHISFASADVRGGMSGSPLFLSTGDVVGVIVCSENPESSAQTPRNNLAFSSDCVTE